jgi:cell division protein ZapA (FtsZ GTPase activity inhibitor)
MKMKMSKKAIALIAILALLVVLIGAPVMVSLAQGNTEKLEAFTKALDYALRGLIEYFKTIIELYKLTISA